MFKYLLTMTISLALSACANQKTTLGVENFGWIEGNCLAIKNPNLTPETSITIASTNKNKHFSKTNITKKTTAAENCQPLLEDRRAVNIDNGYHFYTIQSETPNRSGIAIIHFEGKHKKYAYKECTTTEGILFTVTHTHNEKWRGYYYLGHDIKSNC